MTLLQSFLGFRKVKIAVWLEENLKELEKDFETDFSVLDEECKQILAQREKERDTLARSLKKVELERFEADELYKRMTDKKVEYSKKNKELSEQIRLLEAKSSPDNVWLSAFQSGFERAWGMMKPVMYDGFEKVKEEISNNAKMETLNGLQSVLGRVNGTDSEKD